MTITKSRLRLLFPVSILVHVLLTITTMTNQVLALGCRPDQTETLKRFKNEFEFSTTCSNDTNFLSGVSCDNITGLVTFLELPGGCLRGSLNPNSSLFKLTQLRYLNLSFNNFASSSSLTSSFGQLKNLETLLLSSNGFSGQVPSSLRNLTKLRILQLPYNKLTGDLTSLVQNLPKMLSGLDLSYNKFFGTIPSSLFTMSSLDLSENHLLTGSLEISNSSSKIKNLLLSSLNLTHEIDLRIFSSLKSLVYLQLSGNRLSPISSNIEFPENVTILALSRCNVSEFPRFLKSLKKLEFLDLSQNRINGNVPSWLWSLPNLKTLNLYNNSLTGFQGSLDHVFANSSLQLIEMAHNCFKGSLPDPPVSIINFSAWNNSFSGEIPLSFCNRTFLYLLDLSFNNFTGSIPPCVGNISLVNLRKNKLVGNIPDKFFSGASTQTLDVGYNQLTGKLPRSLLNCSLLTFLNVDHNRIHDLFPFGLKSLPNLKVLILRSNEFHGPIYEQGPLSFPKLQILEISHNRFNGTLPTNYFANWSATTTTLEMIDEEERLYMGDYASDRFAYDFILDLQYKGLNMEQGKVLSLYTAIDFSGNKLQGEIPESIGLLNSLIALNLSNNSFTGHIPMSFANLTKLQSLDMSGNKLSGKIPQELARLSSLAYIDVSNNQLNGAIPQGTQITGQPESSFEGNSGLCGLPLKESCSTTKTQEPEQEEEEEEEILKWKVVVIGILFGLVVGHVVGLYKPKWFIKNNGLNKLRGVRHP